MKLAFALAVLLLLVCAAQAEWDPDTVQVDLEEEDDDGGDVDYARNKELLMRGAALDDDDEDLEVGDTTSEDDQDDDMSGEEPEDVMDDMTVPDSEFARLKNQFAGYYDNLEEDDSAHNNSSAFAAMIAKGQQQMAAARAAAQKAKQKRTLNRIKSEQLIGDKPHLKTAAQRKADAAAKTAAVAAKKAQQAQAKAHAFHAKVAKQQQQQTKKAKWAAMTPAQKKAAFQARTSAKFSRQLTSDQAKTRMTVKRTTTRRVQQKSTSSTSKATRKNNVVKTGQKQTALSTIASQQPGSAAAGTFATVVVDRTNLETLTQRAQITKTKLHLCVSRKATLIGKVKTAQSAVTSATNAAGATNTALLDAKQNLASDRAKVKKWQKGIKFCQSKIAQYRAVARYYAATKDTYKDEVQEEKGAKWKLKEQLADASTDDQKLAVNQRLAQADAFIAAATTGAANATTAAKPSYDQTTFWIKQRKSNIKSLKQAQAAATKSDKTARSAAMANFKAQQSSQKAVAALKAAKTNLLTTSSRCDDLADKLKRLNKLVANQQSKVTEDDTTLSEEEDADIGPEFTQAGQEEDEDLEEADDDDDDEEEEEDGDAEDEDESEGEEEEEGEEEDA